MFYGFPIVYLRPLGGLPLTVCEAFMCTVRKFFFPSITAVWSRSKVSTHQSRRRFILLRRKGFRFQVKNFLL